MLAHSSSSFVDLDLALKATVTVGRIGLVKETPCSRKACHLFLAEGLRVNGVGTSEIQIARHRLLSTIHENLSTLWAKIAACRFYR